MSVPVFTCGLYRPGHDVHWIQVNQSAKDRINSPMAGNLVEVRADGTLALVLGGQLLRLWNHDPDRLEQLVARDHGRIVYKPRWGLLMTPSNYCFCVAGVDDPQQRPCPATPPTGTPVELVQQAGGFVIPMGTGRDPEAGR